jgi:hypothetical protein
MTTEPSELVVVREQTPALAGFATASPALTLQRGKAVADAAAPVIKDLGMVKRIHQSFHVYFDGWTMVGAMVGVFPVTVRTWEIGQDEGYGANVEARSLSGEVVGAADAIVMRDEEVGGKQKWLEAPAFQVVSMAQTRAGGKALRQPLGWIMRLAGYEATPAEEMDEAAAARGETVTGGRGVAPGWRDIAEQNSTHQRMNVHLANNQLGEWAAMWLDSKGYHRPLSKPQMADLRRAVDRELEDRKTDGPAAATPRGATGPSTTSSPPDPPDSAPDGSRSPRPGAGGEDLTSPAPNPPSTAAAGAGGPTSQPSPASPGDGGDHQSAPSQRLGEGDEGADHQSRPGSSADTGETTGGGGEAGPGRDHNPRRRRA